MLSRLVSRPAAAAFTRSTASCGTVVATRSFTTLCSSRFSFPRYVRSVVPSSSVLTVSSRSLVDLAQSQKEAEPHERYAEFEPPVTVGKPAAHFTEQAVVDGVIKKISLSDYEKQWIILLFYPLDWTFVCPTELIAFSDRIAEFRQLNAQVIGISVDSAYSHLAWIKTSREDGGLGKISFPLVADLTKQISNWYGVLKQDEGVAYRGLFIIDPKLNTRQVTINDLPIGRSVDETLRLLKAFQHHEKHGEVCPADWDQGKDAMIADPEGAKSYFKKTHKNKKQN